MPYYEWGPPFAGLGRGRRGFGGRCPPTERLLEDGKNVRVHVTDHDEGRVAWSGELGVGVRRPEQGQSAENAEGSD